jgi:hypothetical protein
VDERQGPDLAAGPNPQEVDHALHELARLFAGEPEGACAAVIAGCRPLPADLVALGLESTGCD